MSKDYGLGKLHRGPLDREGEGYYNIKVPKNRPYWLLLGPPSDSWPPTEHCKVDRPLRPNPLDGRYVGFHICDYHTETVRVDFE